VNNSNLTPILHRLYKIWQMGESLYVHMYHNFLTFALYVDCTLTYLFQKLMNSLSA